MKLINKLLIVSFTINIFIIITIYICLTNEIGDISKNKKIDDSNFTTKGHIYQYYASNAKYKGEREAIRAALKLKRNNITSVHNGWITARFIINYKGYIGRFRSLCINEKYNEIELNNHDKEELQFILKNLNNWEIGTIDNEKVDSYYQITFKIQNGKIIDIF